MIRGLTLFALFACGLALRTATGLPCAPPKPVGGRAMGVVEVGSNGFNAFAILVDSQHHWQLLWAEYGSIVDFDSAQAANFLAQLGIYIEHLKAAGVESAHMHVVASSGAVNDGRVRRLVAAAQAAGYTVATMSAEEEGRYALAATLPTAITDSAFMVDIGSGNTKIAWIAKPGAATTKKSYGAKYRQRGITDSTAYADTYSTAQRIPLRHRCTCFIVGGVPYQMAKPYRQAGERYTLLRPPNEYCFDDERLRSGLHLYRAIRSATGCTTFLFDWDSNFVVGYLLNQKF